MENLSMKEYDPGIFISEYPQDSFPWDNLGNNTLTNVIKRLRSLNFSWSNNDLMTQKEQRSTYYQLFWLIFYTSIGYYKPMFTPNTGITERHPHIFLNISSNEVLGMSQNIISIRGSLATWKSFNYLVTSIISFTLFYMHRKPQ